MTTDTDPVYHCYDNESFTYIDEHGVERFKSGLGKVIREYRPTNFADEAVRNCNKTSEDLGDSEASQEIDIQLPH